MGETKTVLVPAAVISPTSLCEARKESCELLLNIGLFFDGTDNNHNFWNDAGTDTNVWKLSTAYRDDPTEGNFSQYISGVGTPFVELGKKKAEAGGGPFGAGGEARILFGLLQIINFVYASIRRGKVRHLELLQLNALCSNTRVPDHGENESRPLSKEQLILQDLGLQQGLDGASDHVKKAFFSKEAAALRALLTDRTTRPVVTGINLDVFGFSRGAAQARVFVTWLHRYLLLGGQLFGVPSYVRMLGLFDTVASVGPSDAVGNDGHGSWASAKDLQIHPDVKNCVHYVALHELRTNFPSDSIRVGETLPKNCHEHVAPGAHSDVGGGYAPLDQGKGVGLTKGILGPDAGLRLSNLTLNQMYDAALRACEGHAYKPWMSIEKDEELKASFGLAQLDKTRAAVAKYFSDSGVSTDLPIHITLREHGMRYLAWRFVVDEATRFNELPSVKHAQEYAETYIYYKQGQKVFNEQVSAMKRGVFAPTSVKAREIFQQIKEVARSSNRDKVLAMGAFFDAWVHDSYAGFIGKFQGEGEDGAFGRFTHSLAESQGYLRWRNIYQGSDMGLNFRNAIGKQNDPQRAFL